MSHLAAMEMEVGVKHTSGILGEKMKDDQKLEHWLDMQMKQIRIPSLFCPVQYYKDNPCRVLSDLVPHS